MATGHVLSRCVLLFSCQGQAQECLVEKSLKGLTKVKNLSISRVAMKVLLAFLAYELENSLAKLFALALLVI